MIWSYSGRNELMINESPVTVNEIDPTMVEDAKHKLLRNLIDENRSKREGWPTLLHTQFIGIIKHTLFIRTINKGWKFPEKFPLAAFGTLIICWQQLIAKVSRQELTFFHKSV